MSLAYNCVLGSIKCLSNTENDREKFTKIARTLKTMSPYEFCEFSYVSKIAQIFSTNHNIFAKYFNKIRVYRLHFKPKQKNYNTYIYTHTYTSSYTGPRTPHPQKKPDCVINSFSGHHSIAQNVASTKRNVLFLFLRVSSIPVT